MLLFWVLAALQKHINGVSNITDNIILFRAELERSLQDPGLDSVVVVGEK